MFAAASSVPVVPLTSAVSDTWKQLWGPTGINGLLDQLAEAVAPSAPSSATDEGLSRYQPLLPEEEAGPGLGTADDSDPQQPYLSYCPIDERTNNIGGGGGGDISSSTSSLDGSFLVLGNNTSLAALASSSPSADVPADPATSSADCALSPATARTLMTSLGAVGSACLGGALGALAAVTVPPVFAAGLGAGLLMAGFVATATMTDEEEDEQAEDAAPEGSISDDDMAFGVSAAAVTAAVAAWGTAAAATVGGMVAGTEEGSGAGDGWQSIAASPSPRVTGGTAEVSIVNRTREEDDGDSAITPAWLESWVL